MSDTLCKNEKGSPVLGCALANAPARPQKKQQVDPILQPAKFVVVVRKFYKDASGDQKPYTKPRRQRVILTTSSAFDGTGTLSCTLNDRIRFFRSADKDDAVKFDGKGNVFKGADLTRGVTLFAEGAAPSAALDDVKLTLMLAGGSKDKGPNATSTATSVEVTLDICKPCTAAGADPPTLSPAEKISPGRAIHVQNSASTHQRAMLIVQSVKPAGFKQKMVLTTEAAGKGTAVLFTNEKQTEGETPAAELDIPPAGKKVFLEGISVSGKTKDTKVKLGIPGLETDADHVILTIIEAKLDICKSRDKAGKEPLPLSDDEKNTIGRAVAFQDAIPRSRAMMIVHQVKPADFVGTLVLARKSANVDCFNPETGGAALPGSVEIVHDAKFPAAGMKRFVQGSKVSTALGDTGYKLGVRDVEDECDSVAVTVFQLEKVQVKVRGTPCKRDGSRADTMLAKLFTKDSKTFDATAITVLRQCGDLQMEVTAKPAAITVTWDRERAADDVGLEGLPTLADNGGDKKRKVTADATGSFHVFAFVDTNGNGKRNGDEDGITVNVNMVALEVVAGAANNKILSSPTFSNGAGLNVSSGVGPPAGVWTQTAYGDAAFANQAIAMKVNVKMTGGGNHQRRGVDKVTLGYIQNTPNDTFVARYADGRTEKEVITTVPVPGGVILPPAPPPPPPPPAPVMLAFPVRDHTGIANFNGIKVFINTSSDNNPADRKDLATGGHSRVVRFVDSPGAGCHLKHPATNSNLASISGANLFTVFLVGFSQDYDENFTVLATANWSVTYGTFTAGTGWSAAGAGVVPGGAAMTVNKPAVKGESTGMERCPPAYTDNLAMDAR